MPVQVEIKHSIVESGSERDRLIPSGVRLALSEMNSSSHLPCSHRPEVVGSA